MLMLLLSQFSREVSPSRPVSSTSGFCGCCRIITRKRIYGEVSTPHSDGDRSTRSSKLLLRGKHGSRPGLGACIHAAPKRNHNLIPTSDLGSIPFQGREGGKGPPLVVT